MDPSLIGQLLLGGAGFVSGIIEGAQGKHLAKNNIRPIFDQSGLYDQLLTMYSKNASYGIDPASLTYANNQNQNSLTASLDAGLMAGGDPNFASAAYSNYTNANEKLAIADSDMRWQKVNAVAGAVQKLYDARKEEFLYNKDAPFKDNAQAAAAKQKAGFQQTFGSLDYILGGIMRNGKNPYADDGSTSTSTAPSLLRSTGMSPTPNARPLNTGSLTSNTLDPQMEEASMAYIAQLLGNWQNRPI